MHRRTDQIPTLYLTRIKHSGSERYRHKYLRTPTKSLAIEKELFRGQYRSRFPFHADIRSSPILARKPNFRVHKQYNNVSVSWAMMQAVHIYFVYSVSESSFFFSLRFTSVDNEFTRTSDKADGYVVLAWMFK